METPSAISAPRLASALISAQLSGCSPRGAETRLGVSLVSESEAGKDVDACQPHRRATTFRRLTPLAYRMLARSYLHPVWCRSTSHKQLSWKLLSCYTLLFLTCMPSNTVRSLISIIMYHVNHVLQLANCAFATVYGIYY